MKLIKPTRRLLLKRALIAAPAVLIRPSPAEAWIHGSGGGGAPATAFTTTGMLGNLVLTNFNLTALHSGGSSADGIRSLASTTTNQKVYVEFSNAQITNSTNIGFTTETTITGRFSGSNVSPSLAAIYSSSIGVFFDLDSPSHATAAIPTWATGDTIDVAFDTSILKMWFRKNNSAWNVSLGGGQNPGTGTGGLTVTTTPSGPWYFFIGIDGATGDGGTATFAAASWVRTNPFGGGSANQLA